MGKRSVCLWDKSINLGRVLQHGGKILQRMGFSQKGERYLYVEEMFFLYSIGALKVLFEEGSEDGPSPAEIWVAVVEGVMADNITVAHLVLYGVLKRNDYVVRRSPYKMNGGDDTKSSPPPERKPELDSQTFWEGYDLSKDNDELVAYATFLTQKTGQESLFRVLPVAPYSMVFLRLQFFSFDEMRFALIDGDRVHISKLCSPRISPLLVSS